MCNDRVSGGNVDLVFNQNTFESGLACLALDPSESRLLYECYRLGALDPLITAAPSRLVGG